MLKIKDNVDLKELENFGFYDFANHYFNKFNTDEDYISVCKKDRLMIIRVNYENIENILFDLIKADLVEKVVEK